MKLRAFVRRFPSQCETFLSRLMRVQIEIKNNVRSVQRFYATTFSDIVLIEKVQ